MGLAPSMSPSRSPRRELQLQGPRPAPLKVHKGSHRIRKPPIVPPRQPHQPPPRAPVIIYTVSPKVIHANPNEFMSLVQRLTGRDNTSYFSSMSHNYFQDLSGGAMSPAARLASTEKAKSQEGNSKKILAHHHDCDAEMVGGIQIRTEIERIGQFPGILSPNPASLPPIPSSFFSSQSDQSSIGGFFSLSPVLHSSKNYVDNSLFPSPSIFISPQMFSPNTQSLDFFRSLFD